MKKKYIKVKPLPNIKTNKVDSDKVARLYALAEKLHVKIGGTP